MIGLGLLGLGQLLLIAIVGLVVGAARRRDPPHGPRWSAPPRSRSLWFVAGYAFYACAVRLAGALVPRQEELQSTTMPLTLLILVSFFLSFAVNDNPDGTLAHVTAFLPMTAPLTMPAGSSPATRRAWEIVASFAITLAAAAALIPLAARIYEGGVLRTGSAVKLRDAWRGGAAARTSTPAG